MEKSISPRDRGFVYSTLVIPLSPSSFPTDMWLECVKNLHINDVKLMFTTKGIDSQHLLRYMIGMTNYSGIVIFVVHEWRYWENHFAYVYLSRLTIS